MKQTGEESGSLGRFAEPSLLIMISLAGGPKHGYAMTADIERVASVRIGPGTLYGAIARLEQRGWIEPLAASDRRRPYRLTAEGARTLTAQLDSLQRMTRAGVRRLAGS